jgi:5-methyltetrahydrofolate--homocysteine methyltransferase
MNTAAAADLLLNKNEADIRYIERAQEHPLNSIAFGAAPHASGASGAKEASGSAEKSDADDNGSEVFKAVLKGNKRTICDLVQKEIDGGVSPQDILNKELIPAINDVGDKFNKKKYFLPQLIASAEAMKVGINYINPMLKQGENTEKKGVVVIATVEGDIHDIGKNLVSLMLENYGFEVHDLGKDVKCSDIIAAAKEFDADIIGLSALMTTTMQKMKDVVKARNDEKLKAKIMIGGAVITQNYCDEIGADGYSKDAQAAVTVAEELIKK